MVITRRRLVPEVQFDCDLTRTEGQNSLFDGHAIDTKQERWNACGRFLPVAGESYRSRLLLRVLDAEWQIGRSHETLRAMKVDCSSAPPGCFGSKVEKIAEPDIDESAADRVEGVTESARHADGDVACVLIRDASLHDDAVFHHDVEFARVIRVD
jgi:hypothetical protein